VTPEIVLAVLPKMLGLKLLPLNGMRKGLEGKTFRNTISPKVAELLHEYRTNYHTNNTYIYTY
jgi:hypothetical protein